MSAPPPATSRRSPDARRNLIAQLGAAGLLAGLVAFFWISSTGMEYNWQWYRLPRLLLPGWRGDEWVWGPIIKGLQLTIILALLAAPLAAALGLATALLGKSRYSSLRAVGRIYIELVRNTPLLVQLYLLYFMLANLIGLERTMSGVIALAVFEGAFAAEIFRAGLDSVPQGQRDAARALGLRPLRAMRLVYLPQSLPLILPPLANLFVALIKHSSIVSVVALPELTDFARNLIADTYLTFEIWLVVAAVYIALCFALSTLIRIWEKKLLARRGGQGAYG